MNKHKYNERIHAKKRFEERYGLKINRHEYHELKKELGSRKYRFIKKVRGKSSVFFGVVKSVPTYIIYDKKQQEIATFLTPGMEI